MFCKNCGAEMHEGDKFCSNCGSKIDEGNTHQTEEINTVSDITNENTSKKLDNEKKSKNRKSLKRFFIILIVMVVLIISCVVIVNSIKEKERIARLEQEEKLKVELPDVVGKTIAEAEKELQALDLLVKKNCDNYLDLEGNDDDSIVKKVTKNYSNINAGSTVRKGDTIEIWGQSQNWKAKQEEKKAKGYRSSPASTDTIISCAKTLIDNSLRSSSTAKWGTCEKIDEDNYGRCLVYVSLEAQNGFGAYSKLNYFVVLQYVQSDGNFTYKPYSSTYELKTFGAQSVYDYYVTTYKNKEIYPVIQTFLDNNDWNVRPSED